MKFNTINKEETASKNAPAWIASRINSLYFDLDYFNLDIFRKVVLDNFHKDVVYSILLKLKYDEGSFGMAAKQIPFKLDSQDIDGSINTLFNDIVKLLNNFMDRYNTSEIELFQLLYIVTLGIPELKLKNIKNIALNKEFFNIRETRKDFDSKLLPLSLDYNYYGKLLTFESASDYLLKINVKKDMINQDLEDINKVDSLYLYNDTIIINKEVKGVLYRNVYSANSGVLYLTAKDVIISNDTFSRTIGNSSFVISNNKVVKISNYKKLPAIKYYSLPYKASSNPFIGTIDLEAFTDSDGLAKIYAIGFYTSIEANNNEQPLTFYLEKGMTSSNLVLKCINEKMLVSKYNGFTFYAHNFGGYDGIFLLKILKEANKTIGSDYYKLNYKFRDSKLLWLEIKVTKEITKVKEVVTLVNGQRLIEEVPYKVNPTYKLVIVDSYNLLHNNLYDLGCAFNLDIVKDNFPHEFVNMDTLYYKGNTPSIEYWGYINKSEYNNLVRDNWNLKEECLNYLNKDLLSLYKLMDTFNKYLYINYGLQMTDSLTISRLALNIFLKNYLKDSLIPIINKNMYKDIKNAYFGGITEVYKPYGKDLYYYDVNSLYPFAALNPMPSITCTYIEDLVNGTLDLENLFGFFYCKIETSDNYLGLLPVHKELELIMPNGKWQGWYFSEELKYAKERGYKIDVIKGYNFNKKNDVFKDYVLDLYKIKSNNTGGIREISKSLLNNLLGRFGMNINKPITQIVNAEKLNVILSTCEISSIPINITDNDILVSYFPTINKQLCAWHDLDYIKILNSKYNKDTGSEKDKEFKDVSLVIAAAVTSCARIYMSHIKLMILEGGGNIYYTDTDSIVTDKPLSKELVGDGLGQFKLEHEILEGYFISSKTYCLVLKDGSTKIKTKGLYSKSLTKDDFVKLYEGNSVKGVKKNTIVNYKEGSVVIDTKEITLNSDSYKKREKIYKDSKWIDTKPLYYNDGSLAAYDSKNISNNMQSLPRPRLLKKSNIYKPDNKGYSTNNKLLCYSKILGSKYLKYIEYYGYLLITKFIYYIIALVLLLSIIYIYKSNILEGIELLYSLYNDYNMEVQNIQSNKLKFIMENKISNTYKSSLSNNILYDSPENRLSKFIDLNKDWKQCYIDYINNNRPKLNIVSSVLDSRAVQINSSPILSHNNLRDFLQYEARGVRPDMVNNPLGIQGINRDIDEVISMVDNFLVENRRHSSELLNYQSNIMYIIVNKLSPSLY